MIAAIRAKLGGYYVQRASIVDISVGVSRILAMGPNMQVYFYK